MAHRGFPYYNWFAGDWLSSGAHAVMSLAEQGAYRNLLDHAWLRDPPCSLPDDDRALSRLSGMTVREWSKSSAIIRAQFVQHDGKLRNEKLFLIFTIAIEASQKKSQAGKKGNESRWGHIAERSQGDVPAIRNAIAKGSHPNPNTEKTQREAVTPIHANPEETARQLIHNARANGSKPAYVLWFETVFQPAYPQHRRTSGEDIAMAWIMANKPDTETCEGIMAGLRAWDGSEEWSDQNRRFVDGIGKFLKERKFDSRPEVSTPKKKGGFVG